MFPDPLFSFFGMTMNLYNLAHVGGFVPALALALVLARERRLALNLVLDAWLVCVMAALVLTRLLVAFLQQFDPIIPIQWSLAQIITVLGALGVYAALRPRGLGFNGSLADKMDIAAPPVALYAVIARLGCFAAGCCYGIVAENLPWAVTFTHPHAATIYQNVPTHPTQLYEVVGALAILALVLALRQRAVWRGSLMWVVVLTYALMRFVVEFYRGDPQPMVGGLTLNQVVCLALGVLASALLWWRMHGRTIEIAQPLGEIEPRHLG